MIGRLLDQRYQVVEVLGQGGFGHTYIAQDTHRPGNPTCVVKHLKPATSDPECLQTARRLFNSEAETLEKLGHHDQIPRLLAYFEENEEFYLVQEFIAGHPLTKELPAGQRWSYSQVIQLLQEVLSILEFVHGNGVIHRDLKPDNLIRRQQDNKLVLVDFGAVKQVQMQSIMAHEGLAETVAIGTPGYMPSEQGQGRPRPCSDIYALGIIGIQAVTGLNPRQLLEDSATGEIIWRQYAQISEELAAILTKMVRHYFKHRYQTATEVLQALTLLTNPHTPIALAANLSQRMQGYWRGGYQALAGALQMFQTRSALKTMGTNPQLVQSYTPSDEATDLGSTSQTASVNPPPVTSPDRTVTLAPVNSYGTPIPLQSQQSSGANYPHKLLLLMGGGAATVVIALAISAIRQPSPPPATTQNTAEIKSAQPKSEPQNTCFVVVSHSNVRSESGKKTGQVVKAGTRVSATGKQKEGWLEISSPVSGWIWKSRTKNTCS
ncbi:MAG TPA: serine/threonine protein kinase [Cyanobacteria bacterium UBA8803]|nr:serine/threonine protein kinase [Cyanobacteria bacterium UBA9273]HBL59520.1 serine/threonine protein kinase [Cyanobacteria bacterium UBA8803]